ncbi:MAG: bifunctional phosphoribosylaminoimidazolecarboxamide formyltransferase/IMP cyclohydrolase [Planctomycetota bacterium]|nr:bifunctional phosphoribosylaminoimidazolecarboxamide formyltransferase/IMP cyclohydrolase [Planctomycetota bacterium]
MSEIKIKRALIAVYDKSGISEFVRALVDEFGIEIISTGGTARHLKEAGIPVTLVEEITGFPEMLDGRVKTLHPKIHAAILADRDNPEHMRQLAEQGIVPIDMVVVNLYPFKETIKKPDCKFDDAIEMIDIGGPCLLRAAAKNHKNVVVVSIPEEYGDTLRQLRNASLDEPAERLRWADNAFRTTTAYDATVSEWLSRRLSEPPGRPSFESIFAKNWGALRYGENPHQTAELWKIDDDSDAPDLTISDARHETGRSISVDLSFNNFVDANAALGLCAELTQAGGHRAAADHIAVFIKHTNACGAGIAGDPVEAYRQAYLGDPNAAMGGVLAVNFKVDATFAEAVMDSLQQWGKAAGAGAFFVEVWVAPSFDDAAVETIRTRKPWGERARLLDVDGMTNPRDEHARDIKPIAGGLLVQTADRLGLNEDQWRVVTERSPTESEMSDLKLSWLICKHTKSNAISIVKDGMLIGNGAGQMSRVMSCRIATWLARENGHAEALGGSAAASDAFFPFPDGPGILADAGVTAIIQPGGSKRDKDTIAACNQRGLAMIFTGTRHFKH